MSNRFADHDKMREIKVEALQDGVSRHEYNMVMNKGYKSNGIRTTKYNIFNFLPKSLLIQFSRHANIYFLVTAILQSAPYISPLNPFSAILPLAFVIGVSLIREAGEDYSRYKNDKKLNNTSTLVTSGPEWIKTQWRKLHVGELVRVEQDEAFPADLLLIYCGFSGTQKGTAFIETGSLDGEKSLKQRMALTDVMDRIDKIGIENFKCSLSVSPPNSNIHSLEGVIYMEEGKNMPVSTKQLMLRGSYLRNTEYVIGIAIYCGPDSKIMLNTAKSRSKTSLMEQNMNRLILLLLVLQFALILASITGYVLWLNLHQENYSQFINFRFNRWIESLLMYFSYFLIYNTLLPISLMVTLEIARMTQSYFIGADVCMYNAEKEKGCKVMTRSINEELGQIEYVFTDKTGTLTCNVMVLKYFSIGAEEYTGMLEEKTEVESKYAEVDEFYSQELHHILNSDEQTPIQAIDATSTDGSIEYTINTQEKLAKEFIMLITVCHDCIVHMQKETEHNIIK